MMGGVSPETCWASYKYEIKFWYTVASCWIFYLDICSLYTLRFSSRKNTEIVPTAREFAFSIFFKTIVPFSLAVGFVIALQQLQLHFIRVPLSVYIETDTIWSTRTQANFLLFCRVLSLRTSASSPAALIEIFCYLAHTLFKCFAI